MVCDMVSPVHCDPVHCLHCSKVEINPYEQFNGHNIACSLPHTLVHSAGHKKAMRIALVVGWTDHRRVTVDRFPAFANPGARLPTLGTWYVLKSALTDD